MLRNARMPVSSINRVKSIALPLVSGNSEIVPIYQKSDLSIGSELFPGHTIISFNCFIKNLKAFAQIKSLPEAPLPNFEIRDSETQKLFKVLDVEWKSPRKQISLFVGVNNQEWHQVGSVSLLNPQRYPFRIYNLMDMFTDNLALELGDNSRVGVQVVDVGHGLLAAEDTVTLHGSYVEEIFVRSPPDIFNINLSGLIPSGTNASSTRVDDNAIVNDNFLIGD